MAEETTPFILELYLTPQPPLHTWRGGAKAGDLVRMVPDFPNMSSPQLLYGEGSVVR
jgi:hypothetical protein